MSAPATKQPTATPAAAPEWSPLEPFPVDVVDGEEDGEEELGLDVVGLDIVPLTSEGTITSRGRAKKISSPFSAPGL